MNLLKPHFQINKNSLFIAFRFLAEFLSRASTLITFPLMARYLGTEGYGVNSQVNSIVTFLVPIATLGLGFGVVRLIAGKQSSRDVSLRFYSTLVTVSLVSATMSLIVFFLAPLLNSLFIKVDWAAEIIRWSAPLIFLSAIEMSIKDYFRARLRIIAYSVFQILQTIAYVGGVSYILINGGGLLQVIWLWLVIKVLFNIATYIYFIVVGEVEVIPSFMPRAELVSLLRFGFPIVIAGLGTWMTNVGDRWIIGYFMTIDDVAVYNAAYTLAGIIAALGSPFWNPLYPLMSTYFNDNNFASLFQATRKYTNGFSIITIPSVAGLIVLANPLLILFGSPDFSIQPITFGLIILGLFVDQISASLQYLVYIHNEPHFMRNAILAGGISNIILNLIMIPLFGILGAAAATFFSYLILDGMLFFRVRSYDIQIDQVYDLRTILKYCVCSIVMMIAVYFVLPLLELNITILLLTALFGALVYGFALLSTYGFNLHRLIKSI